VPGLYKSGFALGVVGIVYSAYSLIKVCELFIPTSFGLTDGIYDIIGKVISGVLL
jgi:hypothetical protein